MSTERIKMKKLRDLLRLKLEQKLPHRLIGKALNVSPGTVSYYSQAALKVGLTWSQITQINDRELNDLLEPLAKQLRNRPVKKYKPDYIAIHKSLSQKHMTLTLQWEEYREAYPNRHFSYAQFTRLYKAWCKKNKITMRIEHRAGEKAFIDYAGSTIPILCRETGVKLFDAQIFLMTLCSSHYTFAYASRSQKKEDWIDSHVRSFKFFGGVPEILVPDNLKSGVTDSCQFEPEINPTYADMAEHYNVAVIPARPRRPQDKSIVENAVLVASRWILARINRQKFYSLTALNNAISELLTALNHKPFQKREGSRYQQYISQEKEALRPLPQQDYQLAELVYQTVGSDYHIRIDKHYYSVPSIYANEQIMCRYTKNTVEIFHDNERIASHIRSYEKDKKTTVDNHMSKSHQAYANTTPDIFLKWAEEIGTGVLNIANEIIQSKKHPEQAIKIFFGFKKLAKKYGRNRLNQACRRAMGLNCIGFKNIASILEKGLDSQPYLNEVEKPYTPHHENLRGAQYYQKP